MWPHDALRAALLMTLGWALGLVTSSIPRRNGRLAARPDKPGATNTPPSPPASGGVHVPCPPSWPVVFDDEPDHFAGERWASDIY